MRKRMARLLRRIANRLDPQPKRVSITLTADIGRFVAGMKDAG